jgi:hypothetical protein
LRLPDDWLTSGARSALGENLMARKRYAEAEPLLISGYNGLRQREARIPAANKPRLHKAAERLLWFYEETAQPDKAAEWKQKLGELTKPAPNAKLGVETNSNFARLVGRVTPCAPVLGRLRATGAHGVTRPTQRPIPIMSCETKET